MKPTYRNGKCEICHQPEGSPHGSRCTTPEAYDSSAIERRREERIEQLVREQPFIPGDRVRYRRMDYPFQQMPERIEREGTVEKVDGRFVSVNEAAPGQRRDGYAIQIQNVELVARAADFKPSPQPSPREEAA